MTVNSTHDQLVTCDDLII